MDKYTEDNLKIKKSPAKKARLLNGRAFKGQTICVLII